MAVTQKSFKVFTTSDGTMFSEAGSYGKDAKKKAAAHEGRITLAQRRREFDLMIAGMLGMKSDMKPDTPAIQEDDYVWFETEQGPWDGKNGLYSLLTSLDDSYCPGDIDNMAQFVDNIQTWIKAIPGGLEMIAKLNDLKIDGDLL
jgi:hypothetical protein